MKYLLLIVTLMEIFIFTGCRSVEERIKLLPESKNHQSTTNFYNRMNRSFIKKLKNPILEKIAAKKSFQKWKKYEDKYISFIYPDNPNITLKRSIPDNDVPTGIFCYSLLIGKNSYCSLYLDKTNSFDDETCFCGAIIFDKFLFKDGTLLRFSFLKNGYVKNVQALSDKYRVNVDHWTHQRIQQAPYIKIASSIRFKKHANIKELKEKVIKKYGGSGFLEKGMNRKQVIKLLGKPTKAEALKLFYDFQDRRYIYRTTIEFNKDGIFNGFKKKWSEILLLKPKYGSVDWIKEKVEKYRFKVDKAKEDNEYEDEKNKKKPEDYSDNDYYQEEYPRIVITYNLGPLTEKDIKMIFNRFIELTPKANKKDWNILCCAVNDLAECGHKDKRILPVFIEKYSRVIAPHWANWIVEKYNPENKQKLLIQQIERVYAYARKKIKSNDDTLFYLSNLLAFLNKKTQKAKELILIGMHHPNTDIRNSAYGYWDKLPENKAIPLLRKGLKDRNYFVRWKCADAFIKIGTKQDLKLLKNALNLEKENVVKRSIKLAVKKIEKKIQ